MPREPIKVRPAPFGATIRLLKSTLRRLEDPTSVLKQVGVLLLGQAQEAFKNQSFGDFKWPPRYPNQNPPFVNVAGAVGDLKTGARIKQRKFDRRPALKDTGALLRSLRNRAQALQMRGRYVVEVGSTLPYAGIHQTGGKAKAIPVTETVRSNLASLLKKKRKGLRRSKARGAKKMLEFARRKEQFDALSKLGFLFKADELVVKVNRRPFLGYTSQLEKKIVRLIEDRLEARKVTDGGTER